MLCMFASLGKFYTIRRKIIRRRVRRWALVQNQQKCIDHHRTYSHRAAFYNVPTNCNHHFQLECLVGHHMRRTQCLRVSWLVQLVIWVLIEYCQFYLISILTLIIFVCVVGSGVSPFGRYGSPFNSFPGLSPFGRELPIGTPLPPHDPWRRYVKHISTYVNCIQCNINDY